MTISNLTHYGNKYMGLIFFCIMQTDWFNSKVKLHSEVYHKQTWIFINQLTYIHAYAQSHQKVSL